MQKLHLYSLLIFLLSFASSSAYASQLASAKVLSVNGTATVYTEAGFQAPLAVGTTLTQGDQVITAVLSNAMLVFSNGSELVIEENSSITLVELWQQSFVSSKRYEQLQADPSKSQTRLELHYGAVSGHVKKLRANSVFNIETILGTAAVRGTQFKVEIGYNAERSEFIFVIHNKDGRIDVISRYSGNVEYGRDSVVDKAYESALLSDSSEAIPPAHIIVIRLSEYDPRFDQIIDRSKNYPPSKNSTRAQIDLAPPGPTVTPEDQTITIISDDLPLN